LETKKREIKLEQEIRFKGQGKSVKKEKEKAV